VGVDLVVPSHVPSITRHITREIVWHVMRHVMWHVMREVHIVAAGTNDRQHELEHEHRPSHRRTDHEQPVHGVFPLAAWI